MSGKAYTLKEMKTIVHYVTEHKAYGDVKGRKMWVDFANSQLTNRTWQSLKETFLKRILPDIHNPYYNLSIDQIRSFREGCDVAAREKNKLEIVEVVDSNSNSNVETEQLNEQPSTSHDNNGDAGSGEDTKCSKINSHGRDSVETVIIPTCYETAEDVQKVLESPPNEADTSNFPNNTKSYRDLITYSEPLTPMLQEVLHDFNTDEDYDSDEPRMQIVETNYDLEPLNDKSTEKTQEKEDVVQQNNNNKSIDKPYEQEKLQEDRNDTTTAHPKVMSLRLRRRKGRYEINSGSSPKKEHESKQENKSLTQNSGELITEKKETNINGTKNKEVQMLTIPEKSSEILTNSADTILPNNQEALENSENRDQNDNRESTELPKAQNSENAGDIKKSKARKRASSHGGAASQAKKKFFDVKTKTRDIFSDTDTISKKLNKLGGSKSKESLINIKETKEPVVKENTEQVRAKNQQHVETSTQLSQENPCLKSVSLFAEQFNTVSYIESTSDNEVVPSHADHTKKTSAISELLDKPSGDKCVSVENKVVILNSHSESDSDSNEFNMAAPKQTLPANRVPRAQRDKVLANVFGFSSGGVNTKRKKGLSSVGYRKNSAYCYPRRDHSLDSSEWTSESESDEYISPPRGRRNRHSRKYLKPPSARIMSLEDEGGLFVMYGKKIYPLVKDGKMIKNYLTYLPESDPEDEDSYWKLKYVEERQRVEELKKLVNEREKLKWEQSPILPAKSRSIPNARASAVHDTSNNIGMESLPAPEVKVDKEPNHSGNTLKITFAKNNQEIHVEGHWSNIHPVLAEVAQIFNKETPVQGPVAKARAGSELHSDSSCVATVAPIDKDIYEKVDKIETEIFKEIEKRHQEDHVKSTEIDAKKSEEEPGNNVTNRKKGGRIRISSSTSSKTSPTSAPSSKRQKTSDTSEKSVIDEAASKVEEQPVKSSSKSKPTSNAKTSEVSTYAEPVKTRTSTRNLRNQEDKKITDNKLKAESGKKTNFNGENAAVPEKVTRNSKSNIKDAATPTKSSAKSTRKSTNVTEPKVDETTKESDDEVRYMFPPSKPASSSTTNPKTRANKRYTSVTARTHSSLNISLHSESTQGYLDSDVSPPKSMTKRKKKLSLSSELYRTQHKNYRNKRRSYPILNDELSSDSNSGVSIVVRVNNNSSPNSEEYRSDSYQILLPKNVAFEPLEKIDEDRPIYGDVPRESMRTLHINVNNDNASSSSNVSLPLSPELSIVENLSISKELLNSIENHPSLNEIQETNMINGNNQYLISQVDVSMPLMQQECGLRQSFHGDIEPEHSVDDSRQAAVSEPSLNNMDTEHIEDAPSLSDSLDVRLKNLLLESAKKMLLPMAEQETAVKVDAQDDPKKRKLGKRCSTPRKKIDLRKQKPKIVEPVVEEEFVESCSYGGRKSCPPVMQVITDEIVKQKESLIEDADINGNEKSNGKRKKDVIKVKILRPGSKSRNGNQTKDTQNASVHNDSGINESESIISNHGSNESIDLIHNHSETCLHANECIADSVEFIDTTDKSIISINTDSASSNDNDKSPLTQNKFMDCNEFVSNLFCHNAQDFSVVNYKALESVKRTKDNTSDTVFLSPVLTDTSMNSLITEDLSDENPQSQQTKWYLLSDEETTNATKLAQNLTSSIGANLKQIFPITCAVPDLSTITEHSENSRKPTIENDTSTRQDLDSQSF